MEKSLLILKFKSMKNTHTSKVLVTGVENLNERIYTNETALDIVKQFLNMEKPLYGELFLSDDWKEEVLFSGGAINLSKVSHKIIELNMDPVENADPRCEIKATIEFVDTDNGRLAKEMIDDLSFSLRGIGSMVPYAYLDQKTGFFEGECLGTKVGNFEFISIDLIRKETSSFKGIF